MIINAEKYSILPDSDVTLALQKALEDIAKIDGEKTLVFAKGTYYFDAQTAHATITYVTNTMGDKEWKKGETPHENRFAVWLSGQKDLTIDGSGSNFVIRGSMTNAGIVDCENVKLKNLIFSAENPDMHELKVVAKTRRSVDFELDSESKYDKVNGKYCFVGKDYVRPFTQNRIAWWIGKIPADNIDTIWRVGNPFGKSISIKEIKPYTFRATYLSASGFAVGERYYIYDHRRRYAGIFVDRSKGVALEGIEQQFNYSLALVCQDSEDISLTGSKFAPKEGGAKLVASCADFVHICSCRGDIIIKDNVFAGAGDDCLNVHGIHFKITAVQGNDVTVKFCHPQAHGFNPLRVGDSVAFVNIATMLEKGRANIVESKLLDEYSIKLTLDDASQAKTGMAVENKSAIANLEFTRNKMTRIITRGILVTTGGKVRITDNDFDNTSMHSILISDDAKSWYESGPVSDVEIARNRFGRRVGYVVQVMPENIIHAGAVHKNIYIHDNDLGKASDGGFYFKSSDGVVLERNACDGEVSFKIINSQVERR